MSFQFIATDADCGASKAAGASAGLTVGPVVAGEIVDKQHFTSTIMARGIGLLNVCIRVDESDYTSSGLSVRIQDIVTAHGKWRQTESRRVGGDTRCGFVKDNLYLSTSSASL